MKTARVDVIGKTVSLFLEHFLLCNFSVHGYMKTSSSVECEACMKWSRGLNSVMFSNPTIIKTHGLESGLNIHIDRKCISR